MRVEVPVTWRTISVLTWSTWSTLAAVLIKRARKALDLITLKESRPAKEYFPAGFSLFPKWPAQDPLIAQITHYIQLS
jgi:hypothetical protein